VSQLISADLPMPWPDEMAFAEGLVAGRGILQVLAEFGQQFDLVRARTGFARELALGPRDRRHHEAERIVQNLP
jgi:hypothetical protein